MKQTDWNKLLQKAMNDAGASPKFDNTGKFGARTQTESNRYDFVVKATLKPSAVKPVEPGTPGGPAPKYWKPLVVDGVNVHPFFDVPAPYTHLHPYDFISKFIGQKEVPGKKDNVLIAHTHEHSKNLGEHSDHNDYHDEVANCASGQNWVADGCGCYPAKGALASHFDSYPGPRLKKGDLVKKGMLVRVAHPGGHITQANKDFIWDGKRTFEGLGFNQGNTIKVSTYAQSTIVTVHDWLPLPGTVLAPIGTKSTPSDGKLGESTR